MAPLIWIVLSGVLMSALALVGGVTLILPAAARERLILPLVALAAGSLLGGAFFHLLPAAFETMPPTDALAACAAGFVAFFALEQFLHWHHCHRASSECRKPLSYLILLGDALHNFIGGLAIGGTFLVDTRLGIAAWIAAAAHEVPQEFGDFAVLVHAGWKPRAALLYNVLSAVTFLIGGLLAYAASAGVDVALLVPFAAGNFLYVGASDLVPELNRHGDRRRNAVQFATFGAGFALMYAIRLGMV
jgi:zinc and cadmium transporter